MRRAIPWAFSTAWSAPRSSLAGCPNSSRMVSTSTPWTVPPVPTTSPTCIVDFVRAEPPAGLTTGWWRGVGVTHNAFVVEGFVDELAAIAGKDPVEYRRGLLAKAPRALAVLDLAAAQAGWGQPLPAGKGRGRVGHCRFRQLCRPGGRGRRGRGRQRARGAGGLRGRLRHGGQPGHGDGADAGRHHVRADRSPVRRDHAQGRPRRAGQLRHLPDPAHRRGPEGRGAHRPERRGARRHRRARHRDDRSGRRQRGLRRHRQAPAQAADRHGPAQNPPDRRGRRVSPAGSSHAPPPRANRRACAARSASAGRAVRTACAGTRSTRWRSRGRRS